MPLADKSVFSPAHTCADSQLLQHVLAWSWTPAWLRGLKGLGRLSHRCFATSLPPASEQKEEDPWPQHTAASVIGARQILLTP